MGKGTGMGIRAGGEKSRNSHSPLNKTCHLKVQCVKDPSPGLPTPLAHPYMPPRDPQNLCRELLPSEVQGAVRDKTTPEVSHHRISLPRGGRADPC